MADAALLDRLRPGDHVCWSFDGDAERRRLTAAYVRAGLRRDHQVVYLTSAACTGEAIAELTAERVETAPALRSGRLRVATADDSYLASGAFDAESAFAMVAREIRQARRKGYAGLHAIGDMAWAVRGAPGSEQLERYERQINRLYADGYAIGVCLYDQRLYGRPQLSELGRAHPATVTPRTAGTGTPLLRLARWPGRLWLCGEVDLSNRNALEAVLTHLLEDTPAPPVTLDLTELRFADATVCEWIVDLARRSPGRLRIVGAQPSLRRLLLLHGAAEVPGLLDDPAQTPVG
ncbi:MAG TPA: MEDS domain-containing protein [Actinoplanes sp.]|nr:MEDS domain-containing protein [Actinoplanes sp.]